MPPKKRGGGKKKKAGVGNAKRNTNNNPSNGGNTNIQNNFNPRQLAPAPASSNAARSSNRSPYTVNLSESEEDNIPGLVTTSQARQHRRQRAQRPAATSRSVSTDDESAGSDQPPPLLSRTNNTVADRGDSSSSDGDSDSDKDLSSLPGLVERQLNFPHSDDEMGSGSDSSGPPPMTVRRNPDGSSSDESSSDGEIPNLISRDNADSSDDDDSEEYGSSDDDDLPGLASRMSSSGSSDEGEAPAPEPAKRYQSSEGFKKGFLQNNTNSPSQRQRLDETERLDKERIKKLEKLNAKKRAKARKKAEKAELERKQKELSDRLEKERLQQIQAEVKRLRDRNEKSLKIQTFAIKNYRKRRAQADYQKHRRAIIMIQSLARMTAVVRKHGADLQERLALAREYLAVWGKLEDYVQKKLPEYDEFNWEDIKMKRLDQMNVDKELIDEEGLDKMNKKMDSAIVFALKDEEEAKLLDDESYEFVAQPELHDDDDSSQEDAAPPGEETLSFPPAHKIDQIQLTKDVLKWLDRQDSKYRGFFIRRICQLADGERSRILKKHLTGTKTAIWETYLDQKSGQRILWTECETFVTATSDGKPQIERGILVWYVAKHDAVNRLMRQIDRAEDRSSEKLTSALTLFKEAKDDVLQLDDGNRILADPLGDTPLKLHLLYRQDIGKLSSKEWKPRLHLTAEEHKVVDKEGTVLVLGRSGTGKTICIANRMHRDRERNPEASQLFVARSRRICSYVRGLVEGSAPPSEHAQYHTFARFIEKCERVLHIQRRQGGGDWGDSRDPDQMTFSRFKLEIYKQSTFELDALIVWSQIRSFIKGSIEAVKASRPLKREEYLQLGKSRCRLSQKHRELAYSAFEVYQSFMDTEPTLWDESDRIIEILAAVRRSSPEDLSEIRFDRIYIDEVQDYAQAELALFFYLGSPGGLFLAGDTAQSVSWGVDFRFEEVRSIGYNLFEDRRYVPDKPVTVNVNFRSHSGILNVAAAILDRMFDAFPKSANTLTPDIGAFTGPRPSLLKELNQDKLRELVSLIDSVVLLTHDEHVEELKEIVGKNVLVLGIRYSKGLEFPHVIIVDFFSGLDKSHQKPWRCLLSIRSDRDTGIDDLKDTSPELETQLKLLYTAITRCSKRLFFAETERSMAGDAFSKWLLLKNEKPLASEQTVDNVDVLRKTADEWIASGVDFGMLAETLEDDLRQSREYLMQAKYDFGQANNSEFGAKAEAHLKAIDFQLEMRSLITGPESRLSLEQQEEASAAILDLLANGLVEEAVRLLNLVSPFVIAYSKKRLAMEVSTKIPGRYD